MMGFGGDHYGGGGAGAAAGSPGGNNGMNTPSYSPIVQALFNQTYANNPRALGAPGLTYQDPNLGQVTQRAIRSDQWGNPVYGIFGLGGQQVGGVANPATGFGMGANSPYYATMPGLTGTSGNANPGGSYQGVKGPK